MHFYASLFATVLRVSNLNSLKLVPVCTYTSPTQDTHSFDDSVDKISRYRKMLIFRTPPLISDKSAGFTAFLAIGTVIDKYEILKLVN
jgi:hypothetical protein